MRMQCQRLAVLAGVIASFITSARLNAAPFVNLDFESAVVVPQTPYNGFLDWHLAVPGWQHSTGSDLGIVYYGSQHLGVTGWYMLYDAQSPVYAPGTQLAGTYSVGFANGHTFSNPSIPAAEYQEIFLSQTGDIAADVKSMRLLVRGVPSVFIDGNRIPMQSLGGNAYGGDISMYAGTTAELKIVNTTKDWHAQLMIDNIVFSPVAVPEPMAVTVLAAMAMAMRRSRHGS